jgi:thioredoxin-related protein
VLKSIFNFTQNLNNMKKVLVISFVVLSAAAIWAFKPTNEILAIGATAPKADVEMMDVSGKKLTLNSIKKENGLLVIFSCNTCPFVVGNGEKSEGWEKRYPDLGKIAERSKVGMVLVNSNEAKRTGDDSLERMQKQAQLMKYNCSYVVDENHVVADAFGAKTTPHIYLFDKNMKLVYVGAIDDNVDDSKAVKEPYLRNALSNLAAGKTIEPNSTRQLGCSIKRLK